MGLWYDTHVAPIMNKKESTIGVESYDYNKYDPDTGLSKTGNKILILTGLALGAGITYMGYRKFYYD